ncbi:MAG: PilZ domain-containing protein [Gemmatimonadetes bacterium]|nr:PilZ domain-containing protein [Gemmatimonadota bacterium]MCC6771422.1 PilZ domain-containing protein [Gemmatimonadaceae bacterium]
MSYEFERAAYRIPYPPSARPRLMLGDREVPLVDCSERGLRFTTEGVPHPSVGSRISGRVHLLSGGPALAVEGTVIRCQEGEVAVRLKAPGIPVRAVFAEQRFLGQRFPARR